MLIALLLAGCVKNVCESMLLHICDTCPLDDYSKRQCKCLETGELTPGDYGDDSDITADEAQMECDRFRYDIRFVGDDGAASCRGTLAYVKEYEVDACESLGYYEDDGSTSYYTSY